MDESERAEAAAVRDAISAALVKQMDSLILRGPLPIPEHHPLSVLEDGVALRRWLVERFPVTLNPTTNWVLSLGRWANSPTSGSLLTRAFWSAGSPPASVLPGDTPAVERGIILTNFGAHPEAFDELEQVRPGVARTHSPLAVRPRATS